MKNEELTEVQNILASTSTTPGNIKRCKSLMTKWRDKVENPQKITEETHRIAVAKLDKADIYMVPVLDRVHAIEPTTPISYTFNETPDGALVTLKIGGRDWKDDENVARNGATCLTRCLPFVEDFITSNLGSAGCALCGAAALQECSADCAVLEAKLLLSSMERILF